MVSGPSLRGVRVPGLRRYQPFRSSQSGESLAKAALQTRVMTAFFQNVSLHDFCL